MRLVHGLSLLFVIGAVACSADGGPADTHGGSGASGGSGGVLLDAGVGGTGNGGLPSDAACEGVLEVTENRLQPADIVFAVDNSESMEDEAGFVQSAINNFANGIAAVGIDYHVILISAGSDGAEGICAPAPLGSGVCPADSKPPSYQRINREVGSGNALTIILEEFERYQHLLRRGASKHLVVVSDGDSSLSHTAFDGQFRAKLATVDPQASYTFHGVYGFTKPTDNTCRFNPGSDRCCTPNGPLTAAVGTQYQALADLTSGVKGNLCEQEQGFMAVFSRVGQSVIVGSELACEWNIPPPPAGETFDKDRVNVEYTEPGGAPESFGRVPSAAACDGVVDGWYYDDPLSPTQVRVCSQTCTRIQAAGENARMDIEFGCATKVAVPK
ncbi:MAG: VWA domain-containing protein [Polyangiaceae bacterium]|nr:VWA domain-containing protein [Polyangiaceae bacterium]MCW5791103.1 VWA domain-containing protein [Polyangiaceae bacterium]